MNILCIGDIVGRPGRAAVHQALARLKKELKADCVIANAENSAGGAGITERIAKGFFHLGCDVLTLGDHTWDQKDIEPYLDQAEFLIRPLNFPEGTPGRGWCVKTLANGRKIGVVNILGRTFMRTAVDCPFRALEKAVAEIRKQTPVIVVDMHAETTSEKNAIGRFIDGKVSLVFGTHTHIATADETIFPGGTAYITDVGMTGPYDSVIGQDKEAIIRRFLTSRPVAFNVASGDVKICGVLVSVDPASGRAVTIQRIQQSVGVFPEDAKEDEEKTVS